MWERLIEAWQVKMFLAGLFTVLFGDYNAGMGGVLILMGLDFITKICALSKGIGGFGIAWRTDLITSMGMKQSLYKGLCYMALLIGAHQMESFTVLNMSIGHFPVELTCAYLGLIEAKSVLENLRDCGMNGLEFFISFLSKKEKQLKNKLNK
jgi:hypothetical protein